MRVVVADFCQEEQLVNLAVDRHKQTLFIDFASQKIIFSSNMNEIKSIFKSLNEKNKNLNLSKIYEFFLKYPITDKVTRPPVDFSLMENNIKLEDLAINDEVRKLGAQRERPISKGVTRDEIYSRYFKPFTTTAKGIFLLDPYLIENYMNKNDDAFCWFIKKIRDDGISFVRVYSRLWNNNERFDYPIKDIIAKVKSDFKKADTDSLRIQFSTGFSRHIDRHVRFFYGSERITPTLQLGKGISVFEAQTLKSAHSILPENPISAQSRESEIEFARDSKKFQIDL